MRPAIGRLIGPEDDRPGNPDAAVAVVNWSFWKNRFDLSPAIVGQRIVLDGTAATVIGVTPQEFFGVEVGAKPVVWVPTAMDPVIQRSNRPNNGPWFGNVKVMGRLKPGVSPAQARAELSVLDRHRVEDIATASGDPRWRQVTLDVVPAVAGFSTLRDGYANPLLALMAIVFVLLLIACTNVASLLLARAAARQREMAVRVSLGASRLRLVRQVLTESLLLASMGSLIGIVLAYFGADALVRIITSGRIMGLPPHVEIPLHLDVRVLLFTLGSSLLTGMLFGLAPAWSAFHSAPASSLRATGAAPDTPSRRLVGKSLVVAQVAASIALVSMAALFAEHVSNLRNVGLGFERDSVLLVKLDPAGGGYQGNQLAPLYRQLLVRMAAIPGVRSATLSGVTPIEGAGASRFITIQGFHERPEDRRRVSLNWAAPKYFETLGTPLIAGRDFAFEDEGHPRVAIVSRSMARHYFGNRSPLGQFFTFEGQEDRPYEIVGVCGDSKYLNLHEAIRRMAYLHAFQEPRMFSHQFSLRTSVAPSAVAAEAQRAVRDVLRTVTISKVTTMNEQVDASIVPERLIATLSGFFGGLGALLAAIGLYGLLAYTVARRTQEIGVRMALGATAGDVMGMVQKSALALASLGLAAGIPFAVLGTRVAASLVTDLSAGSLSPIVFAAASMLAIALVAAYVPARRAARVNPIDALRQD